MTELDPRFAPCPIAGDSQPVLRLAALDAAPPPWLDAPLPPVPCIGFGTATPPWAARLDAIAPDPALLAIMEGNIADAPLAAAITVQLLRLIEGRAMAEALVLESLAYGLLQGGAEHARWRDARTGQDAGPPDSVQPGAVQLLRQDSQLAITLDRPAQLNAIDRPMRDALFAAFDLAALDHSITAIRLDARGRAFSIGADLAEFGTTRDPALAHAIRMATLPAHRILVCRERLAAHVDGPCIGAGLEMAAFAARITATARAWFQLPELAMGLLPGAGGCVSLVQRIGRQRTARLILSGERLRARTALAWGLVDALVAH